MMARSSTSKSAAYSPTATPTYRTAILDYCATGSGLLDFAREGVLVELFQKTDAQSIRFSQSAPDDRLSNLIQLCLIRVHPWIQTSSRMLEPKAHRKLDNGTDLGRQPMTPPTIDANRLWQSIMDMAKLGPTPEGGSCRLALSAEDARARALLLQWCKPLNLRFEQDAIGNMFLRREGTDAAARPVAFGSHLDTVPTGGRFDGVFGVLSGLELMRALDDVGSRTRAPLELVNWTNEEGSRFRPAMMGSRVHAADMALDDALAITDDNAISVKAALRDSGQAGPLTPSPRGWACWLEAHIEQGPLMEATGADIGIVTATVHARYFQLTIKGEPSHVGPTTMDRRRDSLTATAEIILVVERIAHAAEPSGRASATWIENYPNARGNVANVTRLHCDVRHEQAQRAIEMEGTLRQELDAIAARRRVSIEIDPYATFGPIAFDQSLGNLLRHKAGARQLATRDLIAAAGHDSVLIAPLCPSAMLFVPSVGGITHNPREYSSPEQLARGAQVLLDSVLDLAG
jgi:N-carbamoyl-L-amino-acid hydrolase